MKSVILISLHTILSFKILYFLSFHNLSPSHVHWAASVAYLSPSPSFCVHSSLHLERPSYNIVCESQLNTGWKKRGCHFPSTGLNTFTSLSCWMKLSITSLGMPKQKLGPKHDVPLRCDLIKKPLSLTSGISKDFRMAHLFLLSLLVFLCLCRRNLVASRNERELQALSIMLSLNDPSLSTVQFQYRNCHFHLFCTRITPNLVR